MTNILNKYQDEENQIDRMEVSLEGYTFLSGDEDKEKVLKNDVHSLFVKEMEKDGVSYKHFRLFLGPVFSMTNSLDPIVNILLDSNPEDKLEIRINSPGGLLTEGFTIINIMENNFLGRTDTVIDSHAASMASSVFVHGDRRMIYPCSDIMFHDFSVGAIGKSSEVNTSIDHANEHGGKIFLKEVLEKNYLTKEEFDRLKDGRDYYLKPVQMLERGIATHLIFQNVPIPAEEALENPEKYGLNRGVEGGGAEDA